jgi:diacylglycerol kinase family enzyme
VLILKNKLTRELEPPYTSQTERQFEKSHIVQVIGHERDKVVEAYDQLCPQSEFRDEEDDVFITAFGPNTEVVRRSREV